MKLNILSDDTAILRELREKIHQHHSRGLVGCRTRF